MRVADTHALQAGTCFPGFQPARALQLWIDEQRPASASRHEHRIVPGHLICWQVLQRSNALERACRRAVWNLSCAEPWSHGTLWPRRIAGRPAPLVQASQQWQVVQSNALSIMTAGETGRFHLPSE